MAEQLNIYQKLARVAALVPYVKKDTDSGTGGKGVARDLVVAKLRAYMVAEGIFTSTSQVGDGQYVQTGHKSSKGAEKITYIGRYRTSFINIDTPTDRHEVEHSGQGDDFGDKAPGKASTYAEKLNLIKAFMLETGIADEQRFPGDGDDTEVPGIGPERLANFCASINASADAAGVKAAGQLAVDFITANGNSPDDLVAVRGAGSKRIGAIKEAQKKQLKKDLKA